MRFGFFLALAACGAPSLATGPVSVRLVAGERSWSATMLTEAGSVPVGREVHVPLGADVNVELTSNTFIALFAAPELGLRDFAAPALPGSFHFHAGEAGTFELRGDELCGLPHDERAVGHIVVEDPAAFRAAMKKVMR